MENVSFAIQAPSLGRERPLPTDLLLVDQRGWCTDARTWELSLRGDILTVVSWVAWVTEWFVGTDDVADPDWDTWRGCKSSRSLLRCGDFRGRDNYLDAEWNETTACRVLTRKLWTVLTCMKLRSTHTDKNSCVTYCTHLKEYSLMTYHHIASGLGGCSAGRGMCDAVDKVVPLQARV